MPRKTNLKERLAKIDKKMESTLSSISKLEISLAKYRQKQRVIHELQLKAMKKTAQKERVKFMKELSFPKGPLLSPNFNSHSVQGLSKSDPSLIDSNCLPIEVFALIANYLGPIEIIAFTSVSMTIGHKIGVIYPTLYRNLVNTIRQSISHPTSKNDKEKDDSDDDDDDDDDEDLFYNNHNDSHFERDLEQCDDSMSSLSRLCITKDDRYKCLLRSSMIRLLFRILYFVYARKRGIHSFRVNSIDKVLSHDTLIFEKRAFIKGQPPPRFSFLPLNSGIALYTPKTHLLSHVISSINRLKKGDELESKGVSNKDTRHYIGYDDYKSMKLTPINGDETPVIRPSRIVRFTEDGSLKNVSRKHLREFTLALMPWKEPSLFIDYNELRFMRKIEYLDEASEIANCSAQFECFLSLFM